MRGWFSDRARDYAILIAVAAALTLPNLGGPSLWDVNEGVNAEAAREMQESGTWVIPTFNRELRTAKPVMLYWLQRASYAAFGVSEWSARLPSVLAGWLTILLSYELARRLFGRPTGLLAGVVLATAVEFCRLSHAATPDATLLLFTVLTYTLFWFGHENSGRGWWVPTGAAAGLAVLTKGLVGLALPGLVVLLYFAWNRELARLRDQRLLWGSAAGLLVAGPWYGLVASETRGVWVKEFFLNEHIKRAGTPMEDHHGPIFYHAAALLVLFVPWSVFVGGALWSAISQAGFQGTHAVSWIKAPRQWPVEFLLAWRQFVKRPRLSWKSRVRHLWALWYGVKECRRDEISSGLETPGHRPYRFLLCWFGSYLVFFSLVATKLPNYVLPLYPALAILTARFLVRWREGELSLPRWLMPAAVAGVVMIGVVTGAGLVVAGGVGGLLPAKARVFPGLERWAVFGLVPLAGAGLMGWLLQSGRRREFVAATAATAVGFVGLLAAFPAAEMDRYKAPRDLVRKSGVCDPTRDLRLGGYDWFQPSVVFYSQREVTKLASPEKAAAFLAVPSPPGYLFIPEPTWSRWVADKVVVPHHVAARHFDFYRNCDVLVIVNAAGTDQARAQEGR